MDWGDLARRIWDWFVVFVLGGVLVPRLYDRLTVKVTTAKLLIEEDPQDPMVGRPSQGNFAFFHARVTAANASRLFRARPPKGVRAFVSITDLASGQTVINAPARWVDWPEPIVDVPVVVAPGQIQVVQYPDRGELHRQRAIDFTSLDIHGAQRVDIAVKVEGQKEIFFWNNDNYKHGAQVNVHPPLGYGEYGVEVRVEYEGGPVRGRFRLSNRGTSWRDVRLHRA